MVKLEIEFWIMNYAFIFKAPQLELLYFSFHLLKL